MTNTVFSPVSAIPIFYNGAIAVGAKVYFYNAGGTTPRSIWTDSDAIILASNPVTTDGNGVIPPTWVSGTADYRIVINTATGQLIRTIEGLQGAAAETTVVVGGGETYALTTGDIKWNFDSSEQSGFVKLNGHTIGNAGSGAFYADNGLTALFEYLWNKVSDTYCPVSGGRGANGAADFGAGKTMDLPDMRFRAFIGLSGMGNTTSTLAADYAAAVNPCAPVGSNHAILTSSGMLPSHTHTGTTGAGSGTVAGNTSTDGAHVHTGSTTDNPGDHTHTYNQPIDNAINVGATATLVFKLSSSSASTGAAGGHTHAVTVPNTSSTHSHAVSLDPSTHTHTFTTAATGSGTGFDVINPFRTATCYMKT